MKQSTAKPSSFVGNTKLTTLKNFCIFNFIKNRGNFGLTVMGYIIGTLDIKNSIWKVSKKNFTNFNIE